MTELPPHPQTIRVKTRIPPIYRGPWGLPLRWQDDQSGELPAAVKAFLFFAIGEKPEPTESQRDLLLDYLQHVICAPCWNEEGRQCAEIGSELIQLRLDIVRDRSTALATWEQVKTWTERCLKLGIDPL